MEDNHEIAVLKDLKKLSKAHKIAFGASCCERMLPNYDAFYAQEKWGDPNVLREILDEIWLSLPDNSISRERIKQMRKVLVKTAPDTLDLHYSDYAGLAQYASEGLYSTLECCRDGNVRSIQWVANFCLDTVFELLDLYKIKDSLNFKAPDFWESLDYPPMQREIKKQKQDLELLKVIAELTPEFLQQLRESSYSNPITIN